MFTFREDYAGQQTATQTAQPAQSARGLLEPKTVEINGYRFIISKMPCTVAQQVIFNMPAGLIPVISEFTKAEEQAFKMLYYCERVYDDGRPNVALISKALIDNHVPDFETLIKLEYACLQYNFDFFNDGRALNFLNKELSRAESKFSAILTDFSDKLLHQVGQRSTNSKRSTR